MRDMSQAEEKKKIQKRYSDEEGVIESRLVCYISNRLLLMRLKKQLSIQHIILYNNKFYQFASCQRI